MGKELAKTGGKPIPTIQDLYGDVEWASHQNDLNRLLAKPPSQSWMKEHPFIKGLKYLPIQRVEWLMTTIFLRWWVEVKEIKVIANSVCVTVRVYAIDPITLETIHQDGVGAVDIQTKKDAPATDFNQILPFAVMKAAPSAKSYAIKDACEQWGALFGKDTSRKDFIAYENLDSKFDFETMPATQDQCHELYGFINRGRLSHDERDEYIARVQRGPSMAEYYLMRDELMHSEMSVVARLEAGDAMSMGEINKAVLAKMDDPNA